ncbi:hypothetical protein PspLS_04094 [Pyricularia sp. CBS 133598]|nr:hypothetical protein PspLS_04094 [Pyricularia sp. CBS 133598]
MLLPSFLSTVVALSSLSGFVAAGEAVPAGEIVPAKANKPSRPEPKPGIPSTFYRASEMYPSFKGGFASTKDKDFNKERIIMGPILQDVIARGMDYFGPKVTPRDKKPWVWRVYAINSTDPMVQWGLQWIGPRYVTWTELAYQVPMSPQIIKGYNTFIGTKAREDGYHPNIATYESNWWWERQVHVVSRKIYRPGLADPTFYAQNGGFTLESTRQDPVMFSGEKDKAQFIAMMGARYPRAKWFLYRLNWPENFKERLHEVPRLAHDREELAKAFPMPFELVTGWEEYVGTQLKNSYSNNEKNLELYAKNPAGYHGATRTLDSPSPGARQRASSAYSSTRRGLAQHSKIGDIDAAAGPAPSTRDPPVASLSSAQFLDPDWKVTCNNTGVPMNRALLDQAASMLLRKCASDWDPMMLERVHLYGVVGDAATLFCNLEWDDEIDHQCGSYMAGWAHRHLDYKVSIGYHTDDASSAAFTSLCKMFSYFDKASTVDDLMSAERQLEMIPTAAKSYNSIQQADLIVTRHWMRLLLWKVAVSSQTMTMTAEATGTVNSIVFPVQVARDLLSNIASLSSDALEAHGAGMGLKLFSLATSLADVVTCMPMHTAVTSEWGAIECLAHISNKLQSLRGCTSRAIVSVLRERLVEIALEPVTDECVELS